MIRMSRTTEICSWSVGAQRSVASKSIRTCQRRPASVHREYHVYVCNMARAPGQPAHFGSRVWLANNLDGSESDGRSGRGIGIKQRPRYLVRGHAATHPKGIRAISSARAWLGLALCTKTGTARISSFTQHRDAGHLVFNCIHLKKKRSNSQLEVPLRKSASVSTSESG
jgi:hypothetical protein